MSYKASGQDGPNVWAQGPQDPLTNMMGIKKALNDQMQAGHLTYGRPASASIHQKLQPLVAPASTRGRPYSALPSSQKSKPNLWAVPQTPIICSPTGFSNLPGDHSFNRVWEDAPIHSHRSLGGHRPGAASLHSPASRDDTITTVDCVSVQAGSNLPTSYWTILQPPRIPAARRFGWDVIPPINHVAEAEHQHDSPQQAELEWQALKRVARWHRRKMMLRAIRAWLAGMQFHRTTAHKTRKAVWLHVHTCTQHVWQGWLQYAHGKIVRRKRGIVALHRMQHSKTVKVLSVWLELVHQSRIDSAKEARASHHADKVCKSKIFTAWQAAVHEQTASHRKEARATAHARLRVLTMFLGSWREFAKRRRRHHVVLERSAAKQYKATLGKCLWAWQAAALQVKMERVQQEAQELLAMNKELLSAVKEAEATAADSARRAQRTADEAAAAQEAAATAQSELRRLRSEHKDLKDSTSALASAAQAAADAASAATAQANRHLAAAEAERAHLTMLLTSQRHAARQAAEHDSHSAPAGQPRPASWLSSVPPVSTSTPSKTMDKHGQPIASPLATQGSKPVEASQLSATQSHIFTSSPHARPGLKASQPGSPRTFSEPALTGDPWAASQPKQKLQYGSNPSVGPSAADVLAAQQAAAQAAADAVRKRIEEARAKAAAQAASMWGIQTSVTATVPENKVDSSKAGKVESSDPSPASSRPSSASSALSKVASSRSSHSKGSSSLSQRPSKAASSSQAEGLSQRPSKAASSSQADDQEDGLSSGKQSRSQSMSQRPSKAASSSQAQGLSQRPSKAASSSQADDQEDGLSSGKQSRSQSMPQRPSKAASSSQAEGLSQRPSKAASSSQADDQEDGLSSGKQSRSQSMSKRPSKAASLSQAEGLSQRPSKAASSSQADDQEDGLSSGKQSRSQSMSQRPSKAASSSQAEGLSQRPSKAASSSQADDQEDGLSSGKQSRSQSMSQRPSKAASSSQAEGLSQRPSKAASSSQADDQEDGLSSGKQSRSQSMSQRPSKAASSSQAEGLSQRPSKAASSSQADDQEDGLSSGKQSRSQSLSQRPSKAASLASKHESRQSSQSRAGAAVAPPGLASATGSGSRASSGLESGDLFSEGSGDSLGLDALRDMVLQGIEEESGASPDQAIKPSRNSSKGAGSNASSSPVDEQPGEAASGDGDPDAAPEPGVDADADQEMDVETPSGRGEDSDTGLELVHAVAEQDMDGSQGLSDQAEDEQAAADGEDEQAQEQEQDELEEQEQEEQEEQGEEEEEDEEEERSSWMSGSAFSIGTMDQELLVGGSFHISGDLATALSMRRAASRRSKKQLSMKDRVMSGNLEMVAEQEVEAIGQQEAAISEAGEEEQPDADPDEALDDEDSFADIYKAAEGLQGLVSNPSNALSERLSSKDAGQGRKASSAAIERAPSPSEKASGSSWDELLHQARASAEDEGGYEDVGDEGTEVDWDAVSLDSKMARSLAA